LLQIGRSTDSIYFQHFTSNTTANIFERIDPGSGGLHR